MAFIGDKTADIILGISITGLVSTVVWLLKWCDRLDLECHDLRRDVAHLKRQSETVSLTVAAIDTENEKVAASLVDRLRTVDSRFVFFERKLAYLAGRGGAMVKLDEDDSL